MVLAWLGASSAGLLAAPATPIYRPLRDMLVACDNARTCRVVAVGEADGQPIGLSLERAAGARGTVAIALQLEADTPDPSALQVDGRRLPPLSWARSESDDPWTLADPDDVQRFLDAVAHGSVMTLPSPAAGNGRSPSAGSMSLRGLAAALLLVDDVQGRIGTETAWLRRGSRPAADVPDPPPLPVLPAPAPPPAPLAAPDQARLAGLVRRAEQAALQRGECNAQPLDRVEPLDAVHVLVLLRCEQGAHQSTFLAFRMLRTGQGRAERIRLPLPLMQAPPAHRSGESLVVLTDATYDPETAALTHLAKGRAEGDCGESAAWVYDGQRFQLSDHARLDVCSGAMPLGFPVLWRSVQPPSATR